MHRCCLWRVRVHPRGSQYIDGIYADFLMQYGRNLLFRMLRGLLLNDRILGYFINGCLCLWPVDWVIVIQ